MVEIGLVVLEIQKAQFGNFAVPVNNTLVCRTSFFVFLAADTLLCVLISPPLFCSALNSLSEVIKTSKFGYTTKSGELIQHLLYMDNLKLYTKNERGLNSLMSIVYLFSGDIGMRITVDNSAKLIAFHGTVLMILFVLSVLFL